MNTRRQAAGRHGTSPRHGRDPVPARRTGSSSGAPVPPHAPIPHSALDLLARSDAELAAGAICTAADERFLHGHLAALRAGAALLEVTGRPAGRPRPRTVWDMVAAVEPELSGWTSYFAAGAAARSAVEAGRADVVDDARAEQTLDAAEDFQDAVRAVLGQAVTARHGASALRAS